MNSISVIGFIALLKPPTPRHLLEKYPIRNPNMHVLQFLDSSNTIMFYQSGSGMVFPFRRRQESSFLDWQCLFLRFRITFFDSLLSFSILSEILCVFNNTGKVVGKYLSGAMDAIAKVGLKLLRYRGFIYFWNVTMDFQKQIVKRQRINNV